MLSSLLLMLGTLLPATLGEPILYLPHTISHATAPLLEVPALTSVQCAVLCRRTAGCIKWSSPGISADARPPSDGQSPTEPAPNVLCQLWPLHSDANPLSIAADPLYQTTLPAGYVISDIPTIAFREHTGTRIGGRENLINYCHADDPEAFPTFPNTLEKLGYLKSTFTSYTWVGVWEKAGEDTIFRDVTTNQTMTPTASWFWNNNINTGENQDCMVVYSPGLWSVSCTATYRGPVCEYRIGKNGRRP